MINILNKNKSEIEGIINSNKNKKEAIKILSGFFKDKEALDLLEINGERFYNFCIFYNNLEKSGIKFCFCFISDVIEDKIENILEEKIKSFKNYDMDIEQKINLKGESEEEKQEEKQEKQQEEKQEKNQEKQQKNEFINKIIKTFEKNDKLKSNFIIISDKINRKIKYFVDKKNDILKKMDEFFKKFNKDNNKTFFNISTKIIKDLKNQDLFIKNIYLSKMFFFFIFLFPKENIIDINKIKNTIKNIEKGLSFEVIQKDDINEVSDYIQSQNIKDKIKIQIFITNDDEKINDLANKFSNSDNCFYILLENNCVSINISQIIITNYKSAVNLFFNDFYQNNKTFFPNAKNNREILSKNNIIQKIKYDLELLKIDNHSLEENISFQIDQNEEANKQLKEIGKEYYDSIIKMLKDLLDTSKIKNNKNVVNFFINEDKFFEVFNNLTENLKCKCFYRYFLFNYIKNKSFLGYKIDLEEIKFDNII